MLEMTWKKVKHVAGITKTHEPLDVGPHPIKV